MTNTEVKQLLDDLLPPTRKHAQKVKMNAKLTTEQVDALCSFVSDFEAAEENFDWRGNLKRVTSVATQYQATTIEVANAMNNSGKLPNTSNTMPFMVIQVLYYIGVACGLYKKDGKRLASQSDILQELSSNKLNLSHNFYSRLGLESYLKMISYKQPAMPFSYLGQKDNELGVALKNLIYQAGDYDVLIDLFSGSGAASVAFPRRNNASYVLNDLDKELSNLFEVISDDSKHLILIDYLAKLQEDLKGGVVWDDYVFNKNQELDDFFNNRSSNYTDKEMRIIHDNRAHIISTNEDIINKMKKLYTLVNENQAIYRGSSDFLATVFKNYTAENEDYKLLLSYILNYQVIYDFVDNNFINIDLFDKKEEYEVKEEGKKPEYVTETLDRVERIFRERQLRFYQWYAIACNVRSNPDNYVVDSVFHAAITIYYYSFIVNGKPSISSIFTMYKDWNERTLTDIDGRANDVESKDWERFLEKDFKLIIETLHSYLKKNDKFSTKQKGISYKDSVINAIQNGSCSLQDDRKMFIKTIVECANCLDVINLYKSSNNTNILSKLSVHGVERCKNGVDYLDLCRKHGATSIKHNNPLFYSDSPYIATTQYPVGEFTDVDMMNLIDNLAATGDRFIFSCRACMGSIRGATTSKSLRKNNKELLRVVFDNFEKNYINGKGLYVLTIATNSNFWQNVQRNKITEIMITNFQIHDFTDNTYKNTTYRVYDYASFRANLDTYINK